ncbi:MAG TPA: glycosyltransferase [Burkholderiales bacterium]|nr:glycosyltransferase [Burkholderiales bacterium]
MEASGVRLVQLPPASAADLTFKMLVDAGGREIDAQWKRARSNALLAAWRAADPQILLLELFPFGRRQMRFELLPLLDAAAGAARRPAIVCSVRDVLGGRKSPERQQETLDLVERYFDWVLVHGDPAAIDFERTFPPAARLKPKIRYTGYVVDNADRIQTDSSAGKEEVIVSAGGGAVGAGLLETAIRARPLTALHDRTWRVLAGGNLPEASFSSLTRLAAAPGDGQVVVEPARRDFTTLLANCEVSVSQAGYNTLMEVVRARARAVVVPFAGGHETEQTLRARCFAERGLVELVEESALGPETLATAIDRVARNPRPAPGAIDLDGARRSAALIAQWAKERAA